MTKVLQQDLLITYGDILLKGLAFTQVEEDRNWVSLLFGCGRRSYRNKTLNEKVSEVLEDGIFDSVEDPTWKIVQRMLDQPEKFMTNTEWKEKDLKDGEIYVSLYSSNMYLIDRDTEVKFEYRYQKPETEVSINGEDISFHLNIELISPKCFNTREQGLIQNCIQHILNEKSWKRNRENLQKAREVANCERKDLVDKYSNL